MNIYYNYLAPGEIVEMEGEYTALLDEPRAERVLSNRERNRVLT